MFPCRLAEGRVDADVTVAAPSGEVLVFQFAQRDDRDDWVCVGPLLDGPLVALHHAKHYEVALTLPTDQQLFLLT